MTVREARLDEVSDLARLVVNAYAQFADDLTEENWQAMKRGLIAAAEDAKGGVPLVAEGDGAVGDFVIYFPPVRTGPCFLPIGHRCAFLAWIRSYAAAASPSD